MKINHLKRYDRETHVFTGTYRRRSPKHLCVQGLKFAKSDPMRMQDSRVLRDHCWMYYADAKEAGLRSGDKVRFIATVYRYDGNKFGLCNMGGLEITFRASDNPETKRRKRKNRKQVRKNKRAYRDRRRQYA